MAASIDRTPTPYSHRLFVSSMTAWAGAGSGEVPGRTLSLAAARLD
jgi:hypothetical protein